MGEAKRKEMTRQELWEKEPEKFHHESELILAVKRTENGMATLVSGERADMERALSRIQFEVFRVFAMISKLEQDAQKGGIITPGNGKRFTP